MEDLALVEQKAYDNCVEKWEHPGVGMRNPDKQQLNELVRFLDYSDEDYKAVEEEAKKEGRVLNIGKIKAKNKGQMRFYSEKLKEIEDEENRVRQIEYEANRKAHPQYYIANGGGCDCFDYVGYDSNTHRELRNFVDWDSGRGNEMMPDWEDNDICKLPDSCVADFKKFASKWVGDQCSCYFFDDFKGNLRVPCKVSTGRKFRGSGTLVKITDKSYRIYGQTHHNYTAHIIDENGVEQTAVASRLEFEEGTIQKIVDKAIANMTIKEIQSLFYDFLWHFGRYKYQAYPKIIAKAFVELNQK